MPDTATDEAKTASSSIEQNPWLVATSTLMGRVALLTGLLAVWAEFRKGIFDSFQIDRTALALTTNREFYPQTLFEDLRVRSAFNGTTVPPSRGRFRWVPVRERGLSAD